MKSNRRLLRLGSFELLESRALLAHVGPPGMFEERFASSPRLQPDRGADFSDFAERSQHGGANFAAYQTFTDTRGGGEFFRDRPAHGNGGRISFPNDSTGMSQSKVISPNEAYSSSTQSMTTSFVVLAPVTTTVVVFIIITPPEAPLPGITSNVPGSTPSEFRRNEPPRSSSAIISPPSKLSEPFAAASSTVRGSGAATRGDAFMLTSLLLHTTESESTSTADNDEQNVEMTGEDQADSTDEQRQHAVQSNHEEVVQQSADETDDAELIELAEEDPLTASKRKAPRKGTVVNREAMLTEPWKLPQSRLRNTTEAQLVETWRNAPEGEEQVIAADDDLIQLLAVDQLVPQSPTSENQQFDAAPPQLQATLGYYQAVELNPESIPTVDSAAVAAAALPPAAAK